jgi:hypothetical protein
MTCEPLGPIGTRDTQAYRGVGEKDPIGIERIERRLMTNYMRHGWVIVGPISTRRMEKGPIAWRKDQVETSTTNCKCDGWVTVGLTCTCRTENGPITWRKDWADRDSYNELGASWMSNYSSHRYMSNGGSIDEAVGYRTNIVRHRYVISSMTKPCSS